MMRFIMRWIGACGIGLCCIGIAHADTATDALKVKLEKRLGPDMLVRSVAETPIAGLYEVNMGNQLIYSDATGRYLLLGRLIDTQSHVDLTQLKIDELNKVTFGKLPWSQAFKVVKGNGSRKIAVFSDPNCPYCKQFEKNLQSVRNVTAYIFLYPVLTPDSIVKAKAIWCAPNRSQAWEDWMLKHVAPPQVKDAGACDTSDLDKNIALGQALNVTGIPTIFLPNGKHVAGVISAEELNQQLDAGH